MTLVLIQLEEVAAVEKRREAEARASKAQSAEKNKFDALLEVLHTIAFSEE